MPSDYVIEGVALGNWVVIQRQFYRRGNLTKEQVEKLSALRGWVWNHHDAGSRQLSALQRFVKTHGHAHSPSVI